MKAPRGESLHFQKKEPFLDKTNSAIKKAETSPFRSNNNYNTNYDQLFNIEI